MRGRGQASHTQTPESSFETTLLSTTRGTHRLQTIRDSTRLHAERTATMARLFLLCVALMMVGMAVLPAEVRAQQQVLDLIRAAGDLWQNKNIRTRQCATRGKGPVSPPWRVVATTQRVSSQFSKSIVHGEGVGGRKVLLDKVPMRSASARFHPCSIETSSIRKCVSLNCSVTQCYLQ